MNIMHSLTHGMDAPGDHAVVAGLVRLEDYAWAVEEIVHCLTTLHHVGPDKKNRIIRPVMTDVIFNHLFAPLQNSPRVLLSSPNRLDKMMVAPQALRTCTERLCSCFRQEISSVILWTYNKRKQSAWISTSSIISSGLPSISDTLNSGFSDTHGTRGNSTHGDPMTI